MTSGNLKTMGNDSNNQDLMDIKSTPGMGNRRESEGHQHTDITEHDDLYNNSLMKKNFRNDPKVYNSIEEYNNNIHEEIEV